jgi:hypothetical protein
MCLSPRVVIPDLQGNDVRLISTKLQAAEHQDEPVLPILSVHPRQLSISQAFGELMARLLPVPRDFGPLSTGCLGVELSNISSADTSHQCLEDRVSKLTGISDCEIGLKSRFRGTFICITPSGSRW